MAEVAGGSGEEIRCGDTNPHSAQTEAEALEIEKKVYDALMNKRWKEVAKIYKMNKSVSTTINRVGDNILHLAILMGDETGVIKLMILMEKQDKRRMEDIMQTKNDWGNTPLHQAAFVGMHNLCSFMAQYYFTKEGQPHRNKQGETPLHVAVVHGHEEAFDALQRVLERKGWRDVDRKNGGNTILHSAIFREHFDIALKIIEKYPQLLHCKNEEGNSALHILANKPSAFKSGTHFSTLDSCIYHSIRLKDMQLKNPTNKEKAPWTSDEHDKSKHIEDVEIAISEEGEQQGEQVDQENIAIQNQGIPCKAFFMDIFRQVCKATVFQSKYKEIREMKKKHLYAFWIMKELVSRTKGWQYESDGGRPKEADYDTEVEKQSPKQLDSKGGKKLKRQVYYDLKEEKQSQERQDSKRRKKSLPHKVSPLLEAAKKGIIEMVEEILKVSPVIALDVDLDAKNIILLAAEHRQIYIYKHILRKENFKFPDKMWETLFGGLDKKGNSALHLAASFNKEQHPWSIPGAALQMVSEIKWYKYIEKTMKPGFFIHYNFERRTALEVFADTHKKLIEDARRWLISTSESCSVVAALIATVAYTSATAVPGGNNQSTGFPMFESQRAFVVFAISSLIALCSSVTALVFFLSIITSRFRESDFETRLPTRLIGGMSALFVSIVTNLVSFCGGHFYIIHHKLGSGVYVLYAVLSFPVMLIFFTSQFGLFVGIIKSRFSREPERTGELQFF